jgi:glycosyltransferase involved in cell wall biosynthesis
MDNLKILHVISYNGKGGAETIVENLIDLQLKSPSSKIVHVLTFSNVYKNIKFPHNSKKFKHHHLYVNSKFSLIQFINIFLFLFKIIFKYSYNIINTHLLAPLYIFLFPVFLKSPHYVHTFHSQAEKELGSSKGSIHYLIRNFYYSRINLISISESVKKSINLFYRLKSKLIFNGGLYQDNSNKISENLLTKISSKTILLAVGHTRKVKNYELLISSFKKINDDCLLIILGSLVDNFKDYDIISERENNIYFMGSVPNVQDYMKIADFLCMTSTHEGMPITLLEAKANGLIPIVTPVRGITDLVKHNYNGIISKDLTKESFELAIKEGLELSEIKKKSFKSNSIKEFKRLYSIEICSDNYLKFYQNLKMIKL